MTLTISVIGTGYLGATHAAAMAELGFDVIGVDTDEEKIKSLANGESPVYEPGLAELIKKHIANGRLTFTTDLGVAADVADVHFVAVGTPQRAGDTGADLTYVDAAVLGLARLVKRNCLIVGKSTVPVGTARRLQQMVEDLVAEDLQVDVAWNPEFLREGFAVEDTLRPDRIVFGVATGGAEAKLREVYADAISRGTPVITTDFETAELVKTAANAFLATKISFINAISEITEAVGGSISTLADALGHDARIGRKFLNAGVGFGGGCLPKDIRALQTRVSELGLDRTMRFLTEMDEINLRRRDRAVFLADELLENDLVGRRVAVLGAAFKPESDDVRDSPALDVAQRLFNQGADVLVYDPKANENAARRFPRLGFASSALEAVEGADLILLLTEWAEFRVLEPEVLGKLVRSRRIIDGRNVLDWRRWEAAGWTTRTLGRKSDA